MSNRLPQLHMVCYDICGDDAPKRLRKIYRILRGYGDHLQYSVFRCALSPMDLQCLLSELEDVIHSERDQILFVPLGTYGASTTWKAFTLGQPLDSQDRVVRIV